MQAQISSKKRVLDAIRVRYINQRGSFGSDKFTSQRAKHYEVRMPWAKTRGVFWSKLFIKCSWGKWKIDQDPRGKV